MTQRPGELRRTLPALVASLPVAIVFVAVLGIVLAAAGPSGLGLTDAQTSTWIAVLYGPPVLIALVLSLRYRQPLLMTGNIFAIIFFASLRGQVAFSELAGASMLAGGIVALAAVLGVTRRIAAFVPAPVVHGLIAGAVIPFVVQVFSSLSTAHDGAPVPYEIPAMVGAAVIAYIASQRLLGSRVPPILPSFVAGLVVAAATGQLGAFPTSFEPPRVTLMGPTFSWTAVATVTPVLVALLTVQSNIPSVVYMTGEGFDPPERIINVVGGIGTIVGSFAGPIAVSLALPPVLLTAGPNGGPRDVRYRAVFLPVAAGMGIAALAGTATVLASLVPESLLLAMAGLALLGALVGALREITRGPLVVGPLFAFAIALSSMTLFGLGPFFWSLVLGTATSFVLEREGWTRESQDVEATRPPVA